jgi:hypothetical protein
MGKILRKGYYATRRGKRVYMRPTPMVDRGETGKWTAVHKTRGIGPLKKGTLLGYNSTASTTARRSTLKNVVRKYGPLSTFRKLNAVAIYTRRTAPSKSKTLKTDRNWVKKNFM